MTKNARQEEAQRGVETTPAPASTVGAVGGAGPVPSARPTSVPDYELDLSFSAPRSGIPLDLAIPIRKRASSVDGAPLRAAFLLSHVDDRMTIAELASAAQIPLADAIENFVLLADLGLIELSGVEEPRTRSGLHQKT